MRWVILAECLFITSFFLPSFSDAIGYGCAAFCAYGIWTLEGCDGWASYAYFSLFTLSNILMVIMPVLLFAVFRQRRIPVGLIAVEIILLLHTMSWMGSTMNDESSIRTAIQVGYYVWLMSMLLMLWCTLRWRKLNSHEPEVHVSKSDGVGFID